MDLDISGDWKYVDNLRSATLRVTGSGDVALASCTLAEPYTLRELDPTAGQVLRQGTVFLWPRSFSSAPPIASIIVDEDDVYWTVWKLLRMHDVEMWHAFCLNLSIITAAVNVATVLKATYGKGRANEASAVWEGFWSGVAGGDDTDDVPARFQPSEETARLEFGASSSREAYMVYFDADTAPDDLAGGEYRLIDSDGNRYRVMRYHKENQIAALPVAIAERITHGSEFHG